MRNKADTSRYRYRVGMRPKKEPGQFHLVIGGVNFDPVGLTEPSKFAEAFYELTGRRDIVFKNFTGLSYWKSVCYFVFHDVRLTH